jgi:hypothetical protein
LSLVANDFSCGLENPIKNCIPDTGYWILDTGYWILDTGYWILDTGYWILDTGYWILDTDTDTDLDPILRLRVTTPAL